MIKTRSRLSRIGAELRRRGAIIDSISRLYRSRRIIMYADVKERKTISVAFHPRRSQPLR